MIEVGENDFMKKFLNWLSDIYPFIIIVLLAVILMVFSIWEIVAQINFDGQYITWRWIPLWIKQYVIG